MFSSYISSQLHVIVFRIRVYVHVKVYSWGHLFYNPYTSFKNILHFEHIIIQSIMFSTNLNLLIQIRYIIIIERQEPAQQRIQQNAHAPQIGLGAQVGLARDQLRGCVSW